MTATHRAKVEIAALAGVKKGHIAIYFSVDDNRPPTLQRVDHYGNAMAGRGRTPRGVVAVARRVVVGRTWLIYNAPELWAVFLAARLVDGPAADIPHKLVRPR